MASFGILRNWFGNVLILARDKVLKFPESKQRQWMKSASMTFSADALEVQKNNKFYKYRAAVSITNRIHMRVSSS